VNRVRLHHSCYHPEASLLAASVIIHSKTRAGPGMHVTAASATSTTLHCICTLTEGGRRYESSTQVSRHKVSTRMPRTQSDTTHAREPNGASGHAAGWCASFAHACPLGSALCMAPACPPCRPTGGHLEVHGGGHREQRQAMCTRKRQISRAAARALRRAPARPQPAIPALPRCQPGCAPVAGNATPSCPGAAC